MNVGWGWGWKGVGGGDWRSGNGRIVVGYDVLWGIV